MTLYPKPPETLKSHTPGCFASISAAMPLATHIRWPDQGNLEKTGSLPITQEERVCGTWHGVRGWNGSLHQTTLNLLDRQVCFVWEQLSCQGERGEKTNEKGRNCFLKCTTWPHLHTISIFTVYCLLSQQIINCTEISLAGVLYACTINSLVPMLLFIYARNVYGMVSKSNNI